MTVNHRLHHCQHRQNDANWIQMHHPLQSKLMFIFPSYHMNKSLLVFGTHKTFIFFPTTSQVECNANMAANSSDAKNTTNPDVDGNVGGTQKSDTDNKIKSISNRIAKRSYRRRSDSQSSTNSVPMDEPMPEQSNENSMNSSRNNREVKSILFFEIFFSVFFCALIQ